MHLEYVIYTVVSGQYSYTIHNIRGCHFQIFPKG